MIVQAYDPGKTTGFAEFRDGRITSFCEISDKEIWTWIKCQTPDVIVFENYRVRPAKQNKGWSHEWNTPFALEVIGGLKLRAEQLKIVTFSQEPAIKPVGYGFAGMPYKAGKKGTHVQDAIAHACYWLVKNHKAQPGSFSL